MSTQRRCPICWRLVHRTTRGNIARHWDSIGADICPMSGEDYTLAEVGRSRRWKPTRINQRGAA